MLLGSRLLASLRLDREEGQVLPLFAAAVVALMLMTGVVVDGGNLFQNKQSLQNAADAAAIAAAYAVGQESGCETVPNPCADAAATSAGIYAGYNGVSGASGDVTDPTAPPLSACPVTVNDTTPPATAPGCYVYPYVDSSGNANYGAVEVWLRRDISNFFGHLLGIATSHASARAVAQLVTGTQTLPGGPSGNYIYAFGNVKITTNPPIEEPVVAGGDIDLSIANGLWVYPDVRLLSAGGNLIVGGNVSGIGMGTSSTAEPETTLSQSISATASVIPVSSTADFSKSGILKIGASSVDGTCAAAAGCEWVKYSGTTATSFTVATSCGSAGNQLCRGYGGSGAPPATTHQAGDAVDGRVAQLWIGGGCGKSTFTFQQCQPPSLGGTAPSFKIWAGPVVQNCPWPVDPSKGCSPTNPAWAPPVADQTLVDSSYANAAVGGANWGATTCTGSPPTFDNDSSANFSLATQNLTPATAYSCTGMAPDGSKGLLAWDPSTNTLTAHGLIFIDGNISIGTNVLYKTQTDPAYNNGAVGATIWTTGTLSGLTSGHNICAVQQTGKTACDVSGVWDPTANVLGIVMAGPCGSSTCNDITINANFQGDMYSNGNITINATSKAVQGTIIGNNVTMNAGSGNPVAEVTSLPGGFPGSQVSVGSGVSLIQ